MSKLDPSLFLVTEDERLRIKNRTKQLVKLAGGPEIFQHSAGVPKDMLSKYGSLSEPNFINAAVIVALDRQLEAPLMVGEMAAMLGYRLVPIEGDGGGDGLGIDDVQSMIKEGGEAEAASLAVASNPTCLRTVREARKEISDVKRTYAVSDRKLAQLESSLLRRAAG
jgi:hypothetical protein